MNKDSITPRRLAPHYSGPRSLRFWARIQDITPDSEHWRIYRAACRLQSAEERFLFRLHQVEQKARTR